MRFSIRRLPLIAVGIVLATGPVWGQAPKAPTAELPSAESILDRYVQVTGGKAAYEAHKTEILKGTIAFPEQGLRGSLTRYAMAPDTEYSVLEIDAIGKFESGVIRGYAWEKSVILGPRIKSDEEARQAMREAVFNEPIAWRRLYAKVVTTGVQTIDGDECYEVVLSPAEGAPEHQFYSKKSGLLVRTTMVASSPMGEVPIEVNMAAYKDFGGVLSPTQSKQKAGEQEQTIAVDSISVNEPIPAAFFEPPEDVAAMIRKAEANKTAK